MCAEVLEITDHHQAVRRLDYDERGMCKIHTPFDGSDEKGTYKVRTLGGDQEMAIISESGLYTLIIRSNKPAAKKFRKWITAKVLPAIRKNGFYAMPGKAGPGIAWDEMGRVSKSTGLKKSQRIRLMELAQRTVQMDPE